MELSLVTVDRSTGCKRKGDDSFDIEGMIFPLLKPIVTTHSASRTEILCSHEQQKDDFPHDIYEVENESVAEGDQDGCETPKSEEHQIPKLLECPPAPRKPKMKRKTPTLAKGFFIVPQDLDSAFLPCRMGPPRKKLHSSKTIFALAVGRNEEHQI